MKDRKLKAARQVVDACKKMCDTGFIVGTWGNVSMRVEKGFVITPSGMDYDKLNAGDMIVVDTTGKVVEGKWKPSTETPLHAAIYIAREDVNAILHTHSIFASSVAVTRCGISPIIEDLVQVVGGKVEVAKYALPGTERLKRNVVEALSEKNAVLLANHGMVGVGKDFEEAWIVCEIVEKSAQILIYSKILGNPIVLEEDEVKRLRNDFLTKYGQK